MSVKRIASKLFGNERGQTATEYMLIIAVVVIGAVAAASVLLPKFKKATSDVATTVSDTMTKSATTSSEDIEKCVGGDC